MASKQISADPHDADARLKARPDPQGGTWGLRHLATLLCIALPLAAALPAWADETRHRYYVDLGWETPAGVKRQFARLDALLDQGQPFEAEILLHGRDLPLFADNRARPGLVRHAARLASSGKIRFLSCAHAQIFRDVALDDLPDHFVTTPYVPERIRELRARGFRTLPGTTPLESTPETDSLARGVSVPTGFPDRRHRCLAADGTTQTNSSWRYPVASNSPPCGGD